MPAKPKIAVIGAGAFGGWTALYLLRQGADVTLIDAWGPGHARSSSGGETRIIRGTYGPHQPYTKIAARALSLWIEYEQRWRRRLFYRTGVLWMVTGKDSADDEFERGSLPLLRKAGIPYEELAPQDLSKRWPQINLEGVRWGIYEPEGGYLTARIACQAVVEGFLDEGGDYRQAFVATDGLETGQWDGLRLSNGSKIVADHYVFACGPWMGKLFPEVIGNLIRSTKQDVFFFGTPPGDDRFSAAKLPIWADHHERFLYGIPANDGRGFKIADDTRGPEFDPTRDDRNISPQALQVAREYLAFRFPDLKDAPLLETRVCQYENTPDNHFLVDRHPAQPNVWLIGGGSGHGFKHGPALGELVSDYVLGQREPDKAFCLSRFHK